MIPDKQQRHFRQKSASEKIRISVTSFRCAVLFNLLFHRKAGAAIYPQRARTSSNICIYNDLIFCFKRNVYFGQIAAEYHCFTGGFDITENHYGF